MTSINIDNKEYNLDALSNDCKAQIESVQFCDMEIARLQAKIAVYKTAKVAYSQALKAALPIVGGSDTIKLN
jgi:hypothetical protein